MKKQSGKKAPRRAPTPTSPTKRITIAKRTRARSVSRGNDEDPSNQNQTDTTADVNSSLQRQINTDAYVPNYSFYGSITSDTLLKYPVFGLCLRNIKPDMYIIDHDSILDKLERILKDLKANLSKDDANKLNPESSFDLLLVNIKEVFAKYVAFKPWRGTDLEHYFSWSEIMITEAGKENTATVEKVAQAIYYAAIKGNKVNAQAAMTIATQALLQCASIIQEDQHAELSDVKSRLDNLATQVSRLQTEVSDLRKDLSDLKTEVSDLRKDLSQQINTQFSDLRNELSQIKDMLNKKDTRNDEINQIKQDVTILKEYCISTAKVHKLLIENVDTSNIKNTANKLISSTPRTVTKSSNN